MSRHIGNNRGMTLIELIIVVAIIAILGAIVVPNFLNVTLRTRLRADIESAKIIKSSMDLYEIEHNVTLDRNSEISEGLVSLIEFGYINRQVNEPQTENAQWFWDAQDELIKVDISACQERVRDEYGSLTVQEQAIVRMAAVH